MHTILIIEDEPRVASLLKNGLEENGYQTMAAYDGVMGLRLFPRWMVLSYVKKSAKRIQASLS